MFGRVVRPKSTLYAISVRQSGTLPAEALFSLYIRLPSDYSSRWTPMPSANASCYRAHSGLSPPSYYPCRAYQKWSVPKCRTDHLQKLFFLRVFDESFLTAVIQLLMIDTEYKQIIFSFASFNSDFTRNYIFYNFTKIVQKTLLSKYFRKILEI